MITPLKLVLLQRGILQYTFARLVGISETRMSRIASGRAEPTPEEVSAMAEALGVSPDALWSAPDAVQIPGQRS